MKVRYSKPKKWQQDFKNKLKPGLEIILTIVKIIDYLEKIF
jgi:hypothetical protein